MKSDIAFTKIKATKYDPRKIYSIENETRPRSAGFYGFGSGTAAIDVGDPTAAPAPDSGPAPDTFSHSVKMSPPPEADDVDEY